MYYIIEEATGTKETGPSYPQSQEMLKPYNYDSKDSILKASYYKGRDIPFVPNFNTIKLTSSSKLTDVISVAMLGGSGLFISKKLKELFEGYKISDHKYYAVELYHKKQIIKNYFWLHFMSDLTDWVDYEKSTFYSRIENYELNDNLHFKSKDEILEFYRAIDKFKTLKAKVVVFRDGFMAYDMFYISLFDKNIYISEALKQAFTLAGITGLEINPTNKIIIEELDFTNYRIQRR